MQNAIFVQSVWIGLSIAAPVGPIGLLVIQRTLQHGAGLGLATGLGAAAADAVFGALGAFGVSAVIGLLQSARVPLALLGGAFLLWLAWRNWVAQPASARAQMAGAPRLWPSFVGTFLLTLSNPATILSFIAIFAALGSRGTPASPAVMVLGVLLGSALWWLLLCAMVSALRSRFDARAQRWVSRTSAVMLAGFALWQWLGLL
jgi:threonine/homoserine/homoserine lactone efflux protein